MKKIANHAQRSRNRTQWKRDLRLPEREHTRCEKMTILHQHDEHQPPTQFWCALGRGVQLLIEHPDMLNTQHPDLHDSPAVDWAFREMEQDQQGAPYPCSAAAITDVNLSAFDGLSDLFDQAYGIDFSTFTAIADANDKGIPMNDIAALIP